MHRISVVTVLKNRFFNFKYCVRQLHDLHRVDLVEHVVVDFRSDDGDIPSLYDSHLVLKHVIIDGPFTINRGRNRGIEAAANEIVFLCDADILVDRDLVRICNDYVGAGNAFFFPIMRDLQEGFDPRKLKDELTDDDFGMWRTFGYGMSAFKKQDFLKVGRFDEVRFTCWGKDDEEFFERCNKEFTTIRNREHKFYHLYHDRSMEFLNTHYNR